LLTAVVSAIGTGAMAAFGAVSAETLTTGFAAASGRAGVGFAATAGTGLFASGTIAPAGSSRISSSSDTTGFAGWAVAFCGRVIESWAAETYDAMRRETRSANRNVPPAFFIGFPLIWHCAEVPVLLIT
jgi:hypothetical protein